MDKTTKTIELSYGLEGDRCGTRSEVKCNNRTDSPLCDPAERKIHYSNKIYFNPALMYSLVGFGPRSNGKRALSRVFISFFVFFWKITRETLALFNWECIYDSHYNVHVEMNQDDNSNVPAELIDNAFDYTNLELNSFSFSQPTFDVKGDLTRLTPIWKLI